MTKEEAYDSQISPLMTQIIAICKEHKIAMLCSFSLDGVECTSALLDGEYEPPAHLLNALRIIRPPSPSPLMMTVKKADGSKEITAFL